MHLVDAAPVPGAELRAVARVGEDVGVVAPSPAQGGLQDAVVEGVQRRAPADAQPLKDVLRLRELPLVLGLGAAVTRQAHQRDLRCTLSKRGGGGLNRIIGRGGRSFYSFTGASVEWEFRSFVRSFVGSCAWGRGRAHHTHRNAQPHKQTHLQDEARLAEIRVLTQLLAALLDGHRLARGQQPLVLDLWLAWWWSKIGVVKKPEL